MSKNFGRGLGPGPVFVYEWITSTRRWQGYALRSLFVLGLLVAALLVGMSGREDGVVVGRAGLRALAKVGEKLFVAVIGTQLTLVLLAAPAATAGAICLDRARGTLTHLLVTDLADREIVLGKLAARLTPVLVLVAATLPVMELLTLLGGVDPDALLGAFVVTLGVAVLGCCLALFFSIRVRRTHEAILATYAVWALWLLGTPMLDQIGRSTGLTLIVPPRAADPFLLAFDPYWRPGSVDWQDYLAFLAGTWGISAVLAFIAVRSMRRICTRDVEPKAARRPRRLAAVVEPATSLAARMLGRVGPSLDFNPVLWREWHRNRPPRWARIVAILFIATALTFSLMAISVGKGGGMPPWVNALQVSIGLLFLSVIAATSLAEERVRGSLDVLMTTPLATWEIVIGKWLGTFRLVPPMAILPLLVILGTAAPEARLPAAIVVPAFVLSSGAAITSLGLAMATFCTRLGRAVGLTVSLYLLVAVGWMFAIMVIGPGTEELMMGSPFFWAGALTDAISRVLHDRIWDAAVVWTIVYALAALGLLAVTLVRFNRCVGRAGGRRSPDVLGGPGSRRREGGQGQGRISATGIRPTSTPSITTASTWPGARTSSDS
jgi:ABC-type transport system involved in multi-copper enzyme maturation permease subunit